jgi:hypothetical protein
MQITLVYEVRVKKKNGKINSFHFEANNIDHAIRRGEKKGRIISIKEVKKGKLIGSLESMNLKDIISPKMNFATKPMITENMSMGQFFNQNKVNNNAVNNNGNKINNGGLSDYKSETAGTADTRGDNRRTFFRRAKGDQREVGRSDIFKG